jgi:23S rRNA (pseudouridine1915-N3)-methyltransferase
MHITVLAVGRLKAGAESELVRRYLDRARDQGRALGVSIESREIAEARDGRASDRVEREGLGLEAAVPERAKLIVLDELGKCVNSSWFAERVASWREVGLKDVVFVVGGPDGISEKLKTRADLLLSFGAMTLPHQMVRAILAEQIYRALTIISGHPYHRGASGASPGRIN